MFLFPRSALIIALLLSVQLLALADHAEPPPVDPALAAADQLLQSGKFADAETSYRALIKADPGLIPAQAGLVRSLLREDKVDEALEAVTAALKSFGELPDLLSVRGDVQFRLAQISEAESSYSDAKALDRKQVRPYLGLARVYRSQSLYRQAYEELRRAHEIAPNDLEVERAWVNVLPRRERLAALQAYLAGPHPEDEEQTQWMSESVEFLKQTADQPTHSCYLVSKLENTDTVLFTVRNSGNTPSGIGITTRLNDLAFNLQLDTGAGGIMVSHKVGERAKLTRISPAHYGGLGDKGPQAGYLALADRINIGELAFQDCVVFVSDKNSVGNEDGLIGADVFGSYLVDVDLPGMRLALSPLPKRPDDAPAPASLNSGGESELGHATKGEPGALKSKDTTPAADTASAASSSGNTSSQPQNLPKDRYVAPEMSRWTEIVRIGHDILVPTTVNDSPSMLFLLDTGAFDNIVSVRAGQQAAKVKSSFGLKIAGLSGDVKKVYHAKVTLRFGHLQQSNVDTVTLDLSKISRQTGTEISGLLGFTMLQMLDLKIDYRDGLVSLTFDPNKVQRLLKK
jgi:tetratricopeptide (TPR) repeat protein